MAMNRKGIFFSLLVVVMISLFFISYILYSGLREGKVVQDRVETLDAFVFSMQKDIERQMYISAFRIIFLAEKRIVENGEYVSNVQSLFSEAFFSGTFDGETNEEISSLMEGVIFSDIASDVQGRAQKLNANVSFSNYSVSISQEDPWNIKFSLHTDIFIEDLGKEASWNITKQIDAYVPIEGFDDPVYLIETDGRIINKMVKTPHESFVVNNDVSNLLNHTLSSFYKSSTEAPSFLNRLEGDLTSDPNGVESIVNLANFASKGISTSDKSVVDHIYFSDSNPSKCSVSPTGMPSWFKLDDAHLDDYQVSCA